MLRVFPLHQQLSQVHVTYTSVPVSVHMEKNRNPPTKAASEDMFEETLLLGPLLLHTFLWLREAFILPRSLPSKRNRHEQPGRHSCPPGGPQSRMKSILENKGLEVRCLPENLPFW